MTDSVFKEGSLVRITSSDRRETLVGKIGRIEKMIPVNKAYVLIVGDRVIVDLDNLEIAPLKVQLSDPGMTSKTQDVLGWDGLVATLSRARRVYTSAFVTGPDDPHVLAIASREVGTSQWSALIRLGEKPYQHQELI